MSQKKAGGSTQLGRDSISKRLGIKRFAGQFVKAGEILVRQRGTKIRPGKNTKRTGDDTIISLKEGRVRFITKKIQRFTGKLKKAKFVEIE